MNDEQLIEQLRARFAHRDTTNFDVFDFIFTEGSPLDGMWYSCLFWPEFVEIDGMVFLKDTMATEQDRQRLRLALQSYGGDRRMTERAFNAVQVEDVFGSRKNELSIESYRLLFARLAEMWRCRLQVVLPSRRFIFEPLESEQVDEIGFVFYQQ